MNVRFFLSHNWIQQIKLKSKGPIHDDMAMQVSYILEILCRNTHVQWFYLWRH